MLWTLSLLLAWTRFSILFFFIFYLISSKLTSYSARMFSVFLTGLHLKLFFFMFHDVYSLRAFLEVYYPLLPFFFIFYLISSKLTAHSARMFAVFLTDLTLQVFFSYVSWHLESSRILEVFYPLFFFYFWSNLE